MIARIAKFLARPKVFDWLVERAIRTPYTHLPSNLDQSYMLRFWLFNPYDAHWWSGLLPSIRLHVILREDRDRHMHDHPWNARTVILKGWYKEVRNDPTNGRDEGWVYDYQFTRNPGDTATLKFGEFHKITQVSPGGVWTLFITYKYRGTWGFRVNGRKVPWREYLGITKPGSPW